LLEYSNYQNNLGDQHLNDLGLRFLTIPTKYARMIPIIVPSLKIGIESYTPGDAGCSRISSLNAIVFDHDSESK
jgi:hypothetical protein